MLKIPHTCNTCNFLPIIGSSTVQNEQKVHIPESTSIQGMRKTKSQHAKRTKHENICSKNACCLHNVMEVTK